LSKNIFKVSLFIEQVDSLFKKSSTTILFNNVFLNSSSFIFSTIAFNKLIVMSDLVLSFSFGS